MGAEPLGGLGDGCGLGERDAGGGALRRLPAEVEYSVFLVDRGVDEHEGLAAAGCVPDGVGLILGAGGRVLVAGHLHGQPLLVEESGVQKGSPRELDVHAVRVAAQHDGATEVLVQELLIHILYELHDYFLRG